MRAGHRCECCGTFSDRVALDAHHVIGKKAHPRLRLDPENGIALTRCCHEAAHRKREAFRAWFAAKWPARWARLEAKARDGK